MSSTAGRSTFATGSADDSAPGSQRHVSVLVVAQPYSPTQIREPRVESVSSGDEDAVDGRLVVGLAGHCLDELFDAVEAGGAAGEFLERETT